jgi:hypothetical protein
MGTRAIVVVMIPKAGLHHPTSAAKTMTEDTCSRASTRRCRLLKRCCRGTVTSPFTCGARRAVAMARSNAAAMRMR